MNAKPDADRPSTSLADEAEAFLTALDSTPPDALTGCHAWRAHELTAHLVAGAGEIALNLEAHGEGRPAPATRGFEEREAPYRAMTDATLRTQLPGAIERVSAALDAVLGPDPDAAVIWTGRRMAVASFASHLRSEFALHRWDLVGDDEISHRLLARTELTDHAVGVLGRLLLARGAATAPTAFSAVVAAPGAADVVVIVDENGARLERREGRGTPAAIGDPAARLLFLWGRRPANPRRLSAPGGPQVLRTLGGLLSGY